MGNNRIGMDLWFWWYFPHFWSWVGYGVFFDIIIWGYNLFPKTFYTIGATSTILLPFYTWWMIKQERKCEK
jgi:hypothetical protein